jgi:hypothetical protein
VSIEFTVRWSFEILSRPVMGRSYLVAEGERAMGGLDEYDRHAQAALVIRNCERALPALHMAYIRLRFGSDPSGYELLVPYVSAKWGACICSRETIETIIKDYCWDEIGFREIRKSIARGKRTASSCRNKAYDALDKLDFEAMNILWKVVPTYE